MEFYKRENNNFNLIRMIAAYAVIYAHAYSIQPNGGGDIITQLSKVTHAGQLAVFIFVFLTGIYLFDSLKKTNNIVVFFVKKIMRIYPMLILTLVITILIGAVFTTLSLKDYFSDPLVYKYFIDNVLNVFNAHELPGVFKDHNITGLNGVLWYVTFIVRIYLVGGIFSWLGFFDTKERMNSVLLLLLVWVSVAPNAVPLLGGNTLLYGNADFPQYTITVLIAGLIYNNFPELRVRWQVLILLFAFCILQKDFTYGNMIGLWAVLAISSAVWLGCLPIVKKIKIIDISFEIFLFGWPISQIVCEINPLLSPIGNAIITIVVTTVIGIGLKYTVGKVLDKATKNIVSGIEKYYSAHEKAC